MSVVQFTLKFVLSARSELECMTWHDIFYLGHITHEEAKRAVDYLVRLLEVMSITIYTCAKIHIILCNTNYHE